MASIASSSPKLTCRGEAGLAEADAQVFEVAGLDIERAAARAHAMFGAPGQARH
jgi:hypothetical protein